MDMDGEVKTVGYLLQENEQIIWDSCIAGVESSIGLGLLEECSID